MAIQMGGGEMQDTSANYKLTKFEKVSVYLQKWKYLYYGGIPLCLH